MITKAYIQQQEQRKNNTVVENKQITSESAYQIPSLLQQIMVSYMPAEQLESFTAHWRIWGGGVEYVPISGPNFLSCGFRGKFTIF